MVNEIRGPGLGALAAIIAGTLLGVITLGLVSGAVVALAIVIVGNARRSHRGMVFALLALGVSVLGAFAGWWIYQAILWEFHYHPGAGGAIPAPTLKALVTVPLISAGLGLATLTAVWVARSRDAKDVAKSEIA